MIQKYYTNKNLPLYVQRKHLFPQINYSINETEMFSK